MRTKFSTLNTNKWLLIASIALIAASCSKDDPEEPVPLVGTNPAIVLECNYFEQDRTLTDDPQAPVDYIITCEANVNAKLTVEPGVVIAFEENASLIINEEANLKMDGTADKPIILTGVQEEKGFWRGMLIDNNKPSNSMKYVTIEYAGSLSTSHIGLPEAGLQLYPTSSVSIDHCTFSNNKGRGIFWLLQGGPNGSITNSVMTKNDYPMMTSEGFNAIEVFNATNDYTGNVNDYVHIQYGGINADATWKKINVPYYVETRLANRFDVKDDAILTIEPGTDIMFSSGTKFRIISGASLVMIGTPSDPIILRGKVDAVGSWNGVSIDTESTLNEIAHTKFIHAGQSTGYPNGAVLLYGTDYLTIHDVTFTDCFEYGISVRFGNGADHNADFTINYSNLNLDNTPKMFSTFEGCEIPNPYTDTDC